MVIEISHHVGGSSQAGESPLVILENEMRRTSVLLAVLTSSVIWGFFFLALWSLTAVGPWLAALVPLALLAFPLGLWSVALGRTPRRIEIWEEHLTLIFPEESRRVLWREVRAINNAGWIQLADRSVLKLGHVSGDVVKGLQDYGRKLASARTGRIHLHAASG